MSDKRKLKVLIVDDAQTNIIALALILSPLYELIMAKDGKAAIESAEKHLPNLILLDIIMPGIDGFEVLRKLRSSELTKDIPIIFITSLNNVEDEERGLLLGAVDYITKPFHDSIVKARVLTHLKMSEYIRTIEQLCMLDALTGLANRRGFDERFRMEWGRAIREHTLLSILMIDIDLFKEYNDTYGHPQGDVFLQTIAETIKHSLKRVTDFSARWGGEEFAILLPGTSLNGALLVAEEIRKNVERTLVPCTGGLKTSATISVGASSMYPTINDISADFISLADEALYMAKNTGRNRVCAKP